MTQCPVPQVQKLTFRLRLCHFFKRGKSMKYEKSCATDRIIKVVIVFQKNLYSNHTFRIQNDAF